MITIKFSIRFFSPPKYTYRPTYVIHSKTVTCCKEYELRHDKANKMSVRPAKTQISLGICPVWSESSLSAWRMLGSLATLSVQRRLIRLGGWPGWSVSSLCTVTLLVLSWGGSYYASTALSWLYEPTHEIMALIALRKLNLQTCMSSNPLALHVWFLVGPFVYFHTLCVRTAKAMARLCACTGSPEPSLVTYVISTIISWAGSYYACLAVLFYLNCSDISPKIWDLRFWELADFESQNWVQFSLSKFRRPNDAWNKILFRGYKRTK